MAENELFVELLHLDGSGVLAVRGEIDMASAPLLREALERVQALGVPVVLDFAGVTFMDSSGLHVLIEASLRTSNDWCSSVSVRNASEQVRQVLQITALDDLICAESQSSDVSMAHDSQARSLDAS